jgi:serine/threonine protein kinase
MGHHAIGRLLGSGAFGLVFAARDTRTGARVAIKLADLADHRRVEALRSEAEWLASVNRPNIVKLFAQGEDQGYAWIATELVEGHSLAELIADGNSGVPASDFTIRVEPDDVPTTEVEDREPAQRHRGGRRRLRDQKHLRRTMTWFRDLALALHDVHELDVIHRDIKPANIVIHHGGTPYLIDFGLGISEFDTDGREVYLEGTLPYMSPEQASGGTRGIGPRSDLYSLAVTFHEALTGERVVRSRNRQRILAEVIHEPVPPPSRVDRRIPASLDPIFATALQKDESLRYPDSATLATDIEAWLEDRPLPFAPTPWIERCRRVLRRRRDVATSSTLVLAILIVAWCVRSCDGGRSEILETLRVMARDSANYEPALQLCLEHADRFAEYPNSQFWTLYEKVAGTSQQDRIQEMLRFQAVAAYFAVDTGLGSECDGAPVSSELEEGASWLPAPATRVVRITAEALAHLRHLPGDAGFRFIAAFGLHLQDRNAEALALLPAEIGAGTVLEEELRARCHLESEGGEQLYRKTVEAIESRAPPDTHFNMNDFCLAASRELSRAIQLADREVDPAEPAELRFSRCRELTRRVLASDAFNAVALCLQARADLEEGRHRDAIQGFEVAAAQIEKIGGTLEDKIGTWFYIAVATLLSAGEVAKAPGGKHQIDALAARLEPALLRYPLLAASLQRELNRRKAYRAAYLWASEVLENPRLGRSRATPRFIVAAATTQYYFDSILSPDLPEREHVERAIEVVEGLGRGLRRLYRADLPEEARTHIGQVQVLRSWWAKRGMEELCQRGLQREAIPLAERILDVAAFLDENGLEIGLEGLWSVVWAHAHLWMHGRTDRRSQHRDEVQRSLPRVRQLIEAETPGPGQKEAYEGQRDYLEAELKKVERLEKQLDDQLNPTVLDEELRTKPDSETHHERGPDPP